MKLKRVRPVGNRVIPYPRVNMQNAPFYGAIPCDSATVVEWPGPDGYWVSLRNDGAITAEDLDVPAPVPIPESVATPKKK